jgi:4-hydroxymandelate synthase
MTMNFPDRSVGYVELYVADAVPALEYLTGAFAFTARALAEQADRYCVLLASGSARLIVTEPRGGGAVADWLGAHGDGVRDIALYRPDLDGVIERARQRGLPVVLDPMLNAATGTRHARVGGVGSVCHTLLGVGSNGDLPPGFDWQPLRTIADTIAVPAPPALESIDHVAVCLPAGTLDATAATYQSVFDMRIIHSERVEMGDTALNSHVLRDAAGLNFVMSEPDPAYVQVDRFLAAHRTAGVQHVAFLTDDLVAAVRAYRARGVGFVGASPAARCWSLAACIEDAPGDGVLHQIFTSYPHERDALCYALVERRGRRGRNTYNVGAFGVGEVDLLARFAAAAPHLSAN